MARQIPYGSLGAAERTLDEFYRRLANSMSSRCAALARIADNDASNPDHVLIDREWDEVYRLGAEIASINDDIDGLEADMRRACGWRD